MDFDLAHLDNPIDPYSMGFQIGVGIQNGHGQFINIDPKIGTLVSNYVVRGSNHSKDYHPKYKEELSMSFCPSDSPFYQDSRFANPNNATEAQD